MKTRVSLSRWRERVRVRVGRSGFPLTSVLSPKGRGGIFGVIFYLRSEIRMSTGLKFKPRIIGFVCHW